jgi:hypothetical protein
MNALIDIAFSLGLLVLLMFSVSIATATARTLAYIAAIVCCRPGRRSDSPDAKKMGGAKTAHATSVRAAQAETRPFLGHPHSIS